MNISPDYHVHTNFSCDSEASMEAVCQAALKLGMREIAITDHADFEPRDVCAGYFRPTPYWRAIERCRSVFDDQLTIRAGVECGESHIHRRQVTDLLSAHDYDFVLGSIHWADGRPTFDGDFFDGIALDEGLTLYFDELARLAEEGDYDVLAHVDIIRRAAYRRFGHQTLDLQPHEARVRRVLRIVAQRGKGIEINTGYVRKGMGDPGPSVEMLRWFREEGGRIVTLGSDSHKPHQVGSAFDQGAQMLRQAGFNQPSTFERRQVIAR
jgi:histidinol-phosphatase (PHP family)